MGALDAAVRDAAARGLTPLFTVYFAPAWREAPNRPPGVDPGTWMPNPDAYGAFAKALATRYSGTYGGLPAVRAYEAWNESNLAIFLSPQYHDGGQFSIAWYRALLNAFYDNVKSVSGQNKVLVGGMAPYGDPPGAFRTRPLTFLRRLFCLKDNLKRAKCPTKAKFDILAFHAITLGGGPDKHAHNANDAAAGDLPRVREILRAAEKRHSIAPNRKRRELWVTEMWWESNPPDAEAPWSVSLSKQAKYIEEAIMQLHDQGAKVVINFPLVDTTDIAGNLQSGLFFADGSPKPSFTAFRFPLVAKRVRGGAKVSGKSPSAGKLKIQKSRGGGKWKTVKRLKVRENEVFSTKVRNQGTKGFRGVISGQKSLVWR